MPVWNVAADVHFTSVTVYLFIIMSRKENTKEVKNTQVILSDCRINSHSEEINVDIDVYSLVYFFVYFRYFASWFRKYYSIITVKCFYLWRKHGISQMCKGAPAVPAVPDSQWLLRPTGVSCRHFVKDAGGSQQGKITEWDRYPNPNPSPFCMEW